MPQVLPVWPAQVLPVFLACTNLVGAAAVTTTWEDNNIQSISLKQFPFFLYNLNITEVVGFEVVVELMCNRNSVAQIDDLGY